MRPRPRFESGIWRRPDKKQGPVPARPLRTGFGWHDTVQTMSAVVMAAIALVGTIYLIEESNDRTQSRITRAWTLLNLARSDPRSKSSNVGQIEAIETLHSSGARLVGVDLSNMDLTGLNLECRFNLFSLITFRPFEKCADLSGATFQNSILINTNFNGANLEKTSFEYSMISASTFVDASVDGEIFRESTLFTNNIVDNVIIHSKFFGGDVYDLDFVEYYKNKIDEILRDQCWSKDSKPETYPRMKYFPAPMTDSQKKICYGPFKFYRN